MARFHRTPFRTLLENIFEATENHQAGFTFPIVASLALRNPELVRLILSFHQEVASHGFKHVNYSYLSFEEQRRDIGRSLIAFKNLGTTIRGFRAPYNRFTGQTPKLVEEFSFLWEGSLGFRPQYCEKWNFFRVQVDSHMSSFISIPLCKWSDDGMIDTLGLNTNQMAKVLKMAIKETANKHGVIMFDLHPVRIGQLRYIDVLKEILTYATDLGGWLPTVTEAVEYWLNHQKWKDDASFCCLLTGDIDNFTFFEYLTRLF